MGDEVHVICGEGRNPRATHEVVRDFQAATSAQVHVTTLSRTIEPTRDLRTLLQIYRLLRTIRPDVVDSHTPKGGLLGTIAAALSRTRTRVYHLHGLPFESARGVRRSLLRWSEFVSCRLSTHVVAVSESVLDLARRERLCPRTKGTVIGNGSIAGVDVDAFAGRDMEDKAERFAQAFGIPRSAIVIGFLGRVVRAKGIVELVQAWQVVRARHPHTLLLLVGQAEEEDPVPSDILQLLETDERVRMVGFQEDPLPALRRMDILAFPSHREGFGLAAIEAGAAGIPVVATRVTGLVDAVEDETTGTLVPCGDSAALARALERYIESPRLRELHGSRGRSRAMELFRPNQLYEGLYDFYCSAVNGG